MDKPAWQVMGLREQEYQKAIELLGREPNYVETGLFAVMWSEHCSYKHSRPQLKTFPTTGPQVLQGPGENAGVVDIGDGQAVVFKIESHNHPSAIEPYQGAATGVGGIVRDVFAMGARPIASLNSLRFGHLNDAHQRWLFSGVVAGIAGYGNCLGIPTVAGEVYFNDSYRGNCLVNAMCVGLIDHKALAKGTAAGLGNAVMLVGARTGRDGIHGATFASEELSEASQAKRPSVQVGDPFMEKLLIEACLELIERKLVVGMQDLGAAGLTSSGSEMAARGNSGVELDVALVPRREPNMTPYEVMLSESQERMLVVVDPARVDDVQSVFQKWGLTAVHVGRVTDDGMFRILENGQVVAEVPAKALTDEAPVYHAAAARPAWQDKVTEQPTNIEQPQDLTVTLQQLLASPNIASKAWVYQQYDHMVRDNTVVLPGSDAAVLRIKGTKKGIAMSVDCNSRYVFLDPYQGGMTAVAEAARNLVCAGAKPLAITNCLNFGSPERPEIFWQFKEAVRGMGDACRVLDTPVTGGNVSFYNEAGGQAVYPTPTVGMIGLLQDIELRVTQGFKSAGDAVVLLGKTMPEIGGSEYLAVVHGKEQGQPPQMDIEREAKLQQFLLAQMATGVVRSAHDCAEGGLAVTVTESAISGGLGCQVQLSSDLRPDLLLFSESQSRVVVSLPVAQVAAFLAAAKAAGVSAAEIGQVGGSSVEFSVNGQLVISSQLATLQKTWQEGDPVSYGELASLKEECGVLGAYGVTGDLATLLYMGLFALQHRGEESAGIAVSDGQQVKLRKAQGLVSDVFNPAHLQELGSIDPLLGIAHVRYSTTGGTGLANAQPFVIRYLQGNLALAHNGNLANTDDLRKEMELDGQVFQTNSDSEVILNLIARYRREGIVPAIRHALGQVRGAYSLVMLSDDKLIAVRDPRAFRPLVLGRLGEGYVVASESSAFDAMGAELIRDLEPGEILVIDNEGLHSEQLGPQLDRASCIFEYVYFARVDSVVDGLNVHQVRRRLGQMLAKEHPADADIVIGVPDSALPAAVGYALESGLPYDDGLVKNRYIGRTFIQPGQSLRELKVRLKLNPNRHVVEGKRVVVIDDSIVRGTTTKGRVQALREAGATEVHFRIACPPYISPCVYGIDTPSKEELVASANTVEQIRQIIGADSLGFLSLPGLLQAVSGSGYCLACLTGNYPEQVGAAVCGGSCQGFASKDVN